MYAALWRALPGGRLAKALQALVLVLLLVGALFLWAFPVVAAHLPIQDVTIEVPSSGGTS